MGRNVYSRDALTGGGTKALDAIAIAGLSDGDRAFTWVGSKFYYHHFDASATDAESSPDFIRPDDYASAGVWTLGDSPNEIGIGTSVSGVPMVGTDQGLALKNNSVDSDHDIDMSKGSIMSSDNTQRLKLTAAMTKRLDAAFVAATGNGGLFTGTIAADTQYHIHLIEKDSDGSIDWGYDTSVTAANIPAGYTNYAWLGSVWTDSSSNILSFAFISGDNIMVFDQCSTSPVLVSGAVATAYADITASIQAVVETTRTLVYLGAKSNTANSNNIYLSHDGTNSFDFIKAHTTANFADATSSWSVATNSETTSDYFHDVENNDMYYKISAADSTDILLRAVKFTR